MNWRWCDWLYSYKRSRAFSWQDRITSLFTKWKHSLLNRQNVRKSIFWRKLYCTSKGSLSFRHQFLAVSLFTVSLSLNTGFHCSWGAFLEFNQWEFISDHYHSERSGAKNKNQSATEFKICTCGSEVCNWRDQRFFFSLATPWLRLRHSILLQTTEKKILWYPGYAKYYWTHDFCQTFTICYLSCNISKYKIKRIGYQVRLRGMKKTSYPIIFCLFTQQSRVRNCAFLVANAIENFVLATRILQLVTIGQPVVVNGL